MVRTIAQQDGQDKILRSVEACTMDWDEAKPKPAGDIVVGASLEALSVAELEARISLLEREIERVRRELDVKKARQTAAQSIFKT
jgi:uncharacterized small protein (DUF1192 family)